MEEKMPAMLHIHGIPGVKEFRQAVKPDDTYIIRGFCELQERIMKLEMWVCSQCRQVLFYLPDKSPLKSEIIS